MRIQFNIKSLMPIFAVAAALLTAAGLCGAIPRGEESYTVTGKAMAVSGQGFRGFIFPAGYLWYPYDHSNDQFKYEYWFAKTLYTPTSVDVRHAEQIIRERLKRYAKKKYGHVPECLERLDEYVRQYLGIYSSDQSRRLYVNLVNKGYAETWGASGKQTDSPASCRNCYVPAVVGCEPGACTIEILVDLVSGKILLLSL